MSLSVVYVAETGHVVGAVSLTGGTLSTEAASFVGNRLPLRIALDADRTAELPLRADQLGAGVVDDEAAVFVEPLTFGVELTTEDPPRPKPALLRLQSAVSAKLSETDVTVTLDDPVTRTTRVLVLVSDGQTPALFAEDILPGANAAKFLTTLKKGTFGVLTLVAGRIGTLKSETVT